MPGRAWKLACAGDNERHGELDCARGRMDREPHVVGVVRLEQLRERLCDVSGGIVGIGRGCPYFGTDHHVDGYFLDAFAILLAAGGRCGYFAVPEIGFEESDEAAVREQRVAVFSHHRSYFLFRTAIVGHEMIAALLCQGNVKFPIELASGGIAENVHHTQQTDVLVISAGSSDLN